MAVKYLAVIYRNGKEMDRWPAVEKRPNPDFWLADDILMMRGNATGQLSWWIHAGSNWWFTKPEVIDKTLRLLALLE